MRQKTESPVSKTLLPKRHSSTTHKKLPAIETQTQKKFFTITEKDEALEEPIGSKKHPFLKRSLSKVNIAKKSNRPKRVVEEVKEVKEESEKFTSKGFKLRFFIERSNGL